MEKRKDRSKKLLLALFSGLLTLLLLEFVARIYVTRLADPAHFSRYASLREYRERLGEEWWYGLLAPHRYLGFIGVPNFVDGANRHNAWGFRGGEIVVPKPDGEFRIACLGASTTYSVLVSDHRRSYPAMLESELGERGYPNTTVINGGIPAWSSYETLINYLLRIQDLEPDLIIIHQGFADVGSRLVWPPEAFKGDNSGYFAPQYASRQAPLYQRSALLRILLVETGRILPPSAFGKHLYNQADTSYFIEFAKQQFGGNFPSGIFETVGVAEMIEANSSTYFKRNTENLVINAKERGVQPVLMTFAYSRDVGRGYFDVSGFEFATREHNDIMRTIAQTSDLPLMDLAAVLPGDKRYWGFDGIHVNEKGAALKAKLVADFLVDRELVPRATSASSAR